MSADFASTRAVEFGIPTHGGGLSRWPRFCSFIPYPYQIATELQNSEFQSLSNAEAVGPDGILLPALAAGQPPRVVDIYVPLPRNANYELHSIRYAAYNPAATGGGTGSRDYLLPPQTFLQTPGTTSYFTAQNNQRIPYDEMVEVSVYLIGSGSRDYYGDQAWGAQSRVVEEIPVPLTALQTREEGPGHLHIGALLSLNSTVLVRARNLFGSDLRLNGVLLGYQVQ